MGDSLHYRRDDLTAVGGETYILTDELIYEQTLQITRTRAGVTYLLLLSEYTLNPASAVLTVAAVAADVYTVTYWTLTPAPGPSELVDEADLEFLGTEGGDTFGSEGGDEFLLG